MYNEGKRPLVVLSALSQIGRISQIICVDDGSKNNESVNLIRNQFPNVEIVKLHKNIGKSGAQMAGLKEAKNKYIFLIDADVVKLKINLLRKAFKTFFAQKRYQAAILVNSNTHIIEKVLLGGILVGGTRIIRKSDLEKAFNKFKPVSYQEGPAMNKYLIENKIPIMLIDFPVTLTHKSKKWGFFYGWYKDIWMQYNILNFGVLDWFKQYIYFLKQKIINLD